MYVPGLWKKVAYVHHFIAVLVDNEVWLKNCLDIFGAQGH